MPPDVAARRGTERMRLTQPWALGASGVAARLGTDLHSGLDSTEAEHRLAEQGPNEIAVAGGPGPLLRFLLQFHQPLIYILIAAGIVTALLAEWVDSAVIFAVVILNAVLGYIQESRALAALGALSRTLATDATVIRNGERHRLDATRLVPGDLVVLEAGDRVPADLRLATVRELHADEAAITGESVPVAKQAERVDADLGPGDRTNMVYSSTLVTSGRGSGIVVATGTDTEVGRISELIESAEDIATPLTRRIAWFSRVLLVAILALAGVTFVVGLLHGLPGSDAFLASVALAVAAIPEGLPAVITITLAIGVSRMAGRRAIIRKLPAVETLGSTTVVCSDKTGTLTENEMTVQHAWAAGASYALSGTGYHPEGGLTPEEGAPDENLALARCLLAGLLCNDSSLVEEDGRWSIHGDPTEGSLIVAAEKTGIRASEWEDSLPRIDALPFESDQQYMATLHAPEAGGDHVIFVKGSDAAVLDRCQQAMTADGSLTALDGGTVREQVDRMARDGRRVLAFAQLEIASDRREIGHDDITGLTFLGLQGMSDPPRAEAIASVEACQRAGITVKMITGDHGVTAGAIARQIGIGPPSNGNTTGDGAALPPSVITGVDLERYSDADLYDVAAETHVFARIPPEGKLRLVRALQALGHVVAMTGDGVNDGPALRQADIGVAMGITGTEVAREASDMVLTDDNFASIEAAIEEGRAVFDNLTKFLTYILPTSLGQASVVLVAILLGTTLPMLPAQVLWVNMTTAVLLGLMLAFEPREPGIMSRPPRDPHAPLLTPAMATRMLLVSGILVAGAFGLFYWSEAGGAPIEESRTVAVNLFIAVQIFYLFNCRSLTEWAFSPGLGTNRWALTGVAVMVVLQLAFTYAPPMNALFSTAPIGVNAWLFILAIGVATFAVVELEKFARARLGRPATHAAHDLARAG